MKNYFVLKMKPILLASAGLVISLAITGCGNTPDNKNESEKTEVQDSSISYKKQTEEVFKKVSSDASRLTGVNKKLDEEYLKISQEVVIKRSKIYKLIKTNAPDSAIYEELNLFKKYAEECTASIDSLLSTK